MKLASVQYWLYAVLNSRYGYDCEITRGPLYKRYRINKHDFDVTVEGVASIDVYYFLTDQLKRSNYKVHTEFSRNALMLVKDGRAVTVSQFNGKISVSIV